jgi:hypothetical protein
MENLSFSRDRKNSIVFFKQINAGKRTYFIDVKKDRNNELFLSITESKKIFQDNAAEEAFFQKHQILLYREEFDKFVKALNESLAFIKDNQPDSGELPARKSSNSENPV